MAFIPNKATAPDISDPFSQTSAGNISMGVYNPDDYAAEVAAVPGTWSPEPGPDLHHWQFGNDERGFGGGSHRLRQFGSINSADVGQLAGRGTFIKADCSDSHRAGVNRTWHLSTTPWEYHVVTDAKRADAHNTQKAAVDAGPDQSTVHSESSASYAFLQHLAPNIGIRLDWSFQRLPGGGVTVSVDGKHTAFPWFECLVNGTSIYTFKSWWNGPGLIDLNYFVAISGAKPFTI